MQRLIWIFGLALSGWILVTNTGATQTDTPATSLTEIEALAPAYAENPHEQAYISRMQSNEPPRLVVQRGHGGDVGSVAFSPDGKTLASGSLDNTVKLWDLTTGRELSTLSGHRSSVSSVAFSPAGKMLASGSLGDIRIWDLATGRELRTLDAGGDLWIENIAFSPDGKILASVTIMVAGRPLGNITLWHVSTGRELHTLSGRGNEGISKWIGEGTNVAFSPDGQTLASVIGGNIRIWDVITGRELRMLRGHRSSMSNVAFSPDGKILAAGSLNSVKLWNLVTGQTLRILDGHDSWVERVVFSPDGKTLASGSLDTVKLWDFATGQELRTLSGHGDGVRSIALSPDGRTLALGSSDAIIKLWDLVTGQELRTLGGRGDDVRSIALSPDGKTMAVGYKIVKLWDLASGQEPRSLRGHGDDVRSLAFSPDGKTLASGSWWDKTVKLRDLVTGRELLTLSGHGNAMWHLAFSPNLKILASWSADETVKFWDLATGKELRTQSGYGIKGTNIAFSPDGKMLASRLDYKTIKLWDVTTGRGLHTLRAYFSGLLSNAFSPDGKTLVSMLENETIKLWDVTTGRELRTLSGHVRTLSGYGVSVGVGVSSIAFSPDSKTLASGSLDKTVKLWDLATGRELRTLSGHSDSVSSVAFASDGRILVSGSEDKTVKFWDVATGRLLITLTTFDDGHWAVTDPEGRFDASNGGDNPHLHWVFANTPISLAQLKARYYDPGLLSKIMGFNPESLRTVPKFEDALLHHWPEVAVALDEEDPHRLYVHLTDQGDGYGRVRVRLNGKEVSEDVAAGQHLSGPTATVSLDLDPARLLPGDNRVDVVAWPAVGHIPSPEAVIILPGMVVEGRGTVVDLGTEQAPEQPVTLHAIVAGVGHYAGPQLRLAFAGKDAADFARALELGGARLFGAERVRLHLLTDHTKAEETVPNERRPTHNNLQQAFATVAEEAAAGDILVVFLSGHGVMGPGEPGEADYYYLTREAQGTDLSDPVVRKLWGVSSRELTDWIKPILATKQVMILDTCAAGGAIERLVAERRIPGSQIIALEQLKDRTGFHILAGSAADRISYEASRFGQGLLTYALLSGMKGAALKHGDVVDVQALFQHARDQVPRLARQIGGIQEPRLASPRGESFAIGRMAEEDRRLVPLSLAKLVFLRAHFGDELRWQDHLRLSQRFNDRLRIENYAASRGALVFVDAEDYPDAWRINGRYVKAADGVRVRARLFLGNEQKLAFEVLLPLEEEGQVDTLLAAMLGAMGGSEEGVQAR